MVLEDDNGSEMEMSEEEERVSDVDLDVEEESEGEEETGEAADEDDAPDDNEEDVDASGADSPSPPPRLKLTLRLPFRSTASNSTSNATPVPATRDASREMEIESEDDQAENTGSHYAISGAGPSNSRAMTTRQAVLASVVDSTHVSLYSEAPEPSSKKKKPLNDAEIALRREETARKRRNLSEKKLEDEKVLKAETINRLLKKQSRAKSKRNALEEPLASSSAAIATPTGPSTSTPQPEGEDESNVAETAEPAQVAVPLMYRWVSSTRISGGEEGEEGKKMVMSFSVPVAAMERYSAHDEHKESHQQDGDVPSQSSRFNPIRGAAEDASMCVDSKQKNEDVVLAGQGDSRATPPEEDTDELDLIGRPGSTSTLDHKPSSPAPSPARLSKPQCDVPGCSNPRKYRLVRDFTRGACGMGHLRALDENRSVNV